MVINWASKNSKELKFTLSVLIQNLNNSKTEKEKNKRDKAINAITAILRSRGEM